MLATLHYKDVYLFLWIYRMFTFTLKRQFSSHSIPIQCRELAAVPSMAACHLTHHQWRRARHYRAHTCTLRCIIGAYGWWLIPQALRVAGRCRVPVAVYGSLGCSEAWSKAVIFSQSARHGGAVKGWLGGRLRDAPSWEAVRAVYLLGFEGNFHDLLILGVV